MVDFDELGGWKAILSTLTEGRDLTGAQGLVFSIRGDREYRIWVQVRDENPKAMTDGIEWWFASVRTSPQWRRVAMPFASLRSLDTGSDGRVDLGKVRQVVFLVNQASVKPGTEGGAS